LQACVQETAAGNQDVESLIERMKSIIEQDHGQIDYICIVDTDTLEPLSRIEQKALVAVAVYIGNTRLIDNFVIDLKSEKNSL
jgi:pantoate--beta-alanine ligase